MILKVDILQVFISTSAIFGIGLIWINFNEKVFKMVRYVIAAPFSKRRSQPDYDSDYDDEGNCSDDCSEAHPQKPENPPFYIN